MVRKSSEGGKGLKANPCLLHLVNSSAAEMIQARERHCHSPQADPREKTRISCPGGLSTRPLRNHSKHLDGALHLSSLNPQSYSLMSSAHSHCSIYRAG